MKIWVAIFAAGLAGTMAAQEPPRPSFEEFLAGVRTEAISRGIREDVVDSALATVEEPSSIVLERDRSQAETVLSLEDYLKRRLTAKTLKAASESFERHHALLDDVAARYGVAPAVIVAVWGMESNFGRFSGVRPTIAALATLAWDPRRSGMFRQELFAALEILNNGDIELPRLRGSWAGAMGQVQFMPSSYLKFAEDFDGDGRRDIWSTPADVFASVANYLKGRGWTDGQSWGREVRVSDEAATRINATVARRSGTCRATRDMTVTLPAKEWQQLGVQVPSGQDLPATDPDASMVSGTERHFLVYKNYDALVDYNCSHSYAISVGLLANQLASPAASAAPVKAKSQTKKSKKSKKRRRA